ncbi:MAG: hypothetical protein JOZ52_04115 [Acidobacteria bacterium]|nr:hypothetical protein [Acidobacteriota bacterium]
MLKRMKNLGILLTILALAFLSLTRATPTANARLRQEHDIFYYTDATFTVRCGYYVFPCNGSVHQGGCVTSFYEEDWYDCF